MGPRLLLEKAMANEEHLAILKKGVEVWNKWRKENPEVKPDISYEYLRDEKLGDANFSGADLTAVDFSYTELANADFSGARLSFTVFVNVDLSKVKGLEMVEHEGPSIIDIDTIYLSKGIIPDGFLRGTGVPENFIQYMHSLTGEALQFYSCFISYSSKDQKFPERLHADLQAKGVRCWFAPEDLKIGDKFRIRIDESIRIHDKLLLVLSENSIASDWVEKEVETAFEQERDRKSTVLFPIRLDNAVMDSKLGWAADIKRSRHIGDFSNWKDHDSYQKAFDRLLRDLKAERTK